MSTVVGDQATASPLVERQTAFVAALREAGLRVSVAEGLDAVRVLTAVDLADREQLRAGLAAALVKRQTHRAAFDATFELFWPAVTGTSVRGPSTTRPPDRAPGAAGRGPLEDTERDRFRADLSAFLAGDDARSAATLAGDAVTAFGQVPGRSPDGSRPSWSAMSTLQRVAADTLMAGLLAGVARGGLAERQAREAVELRRRRFEQAVRAEVARRTAEAGDDPARVARSTVRPTIEDVPFLAASRDDLAALRREVVPLARRLAARLTLEQRRTSRGPLDLRATVRSALSTGGVPMTLRHRAKRPTRTDLVVLCDLSQSVSTFASFTLLLVFALREQFSRVRAFGFVDEIDELTRFFAPGTDVTSSLARLAAEADVTWVLGRTDYGRAFGLFAERFPDAIGPRTSLLVLGDARSNYGDLALPVVTRLAERARHAHWLNPERRSQWDSGDSRASAYDAIVPMTECRNLTQLGEFVRTLPVVR